jgi:hypothetical protein
MPAIAIYSFSRADFTDLRVKDSDIVAYSAPATAEVGSDYEAAHRLVEPLDANYPAWSADVVLISPSSELAGVGPLQSSKEGSADASGKRSQRRCVCNRMIAWTPKRIVRPCFAGYCGQQAGHKRHVA